jgi:hypothetical protein
VEPVSAVARRAARAADSTIAAVTVTSAVGAGSVGFQSAKSTRPAVATVSPRNTSASVSTVEPVNVIRRAVPTVFAVRTDDSVTTDPAVPCATTDSSSACLTRPPCRVDGVKSATARFSCESSYTPCAAISTVPACDGRDEGTVFVDVGVRPRRSVGT